MTTPAFDDFRPNWTVAARVSMPLFTGGRISGDERVAQAGVDEARASLELTRERAAVDSRNALETLIRTQPTSPLAPKAKQKLKDLKKPEKDYCTS